MTSHFASRSACARPGATRVEVVAIVAVVLIVVLLVLMALPRGREKARAAQCADNLMLIGRAVLIYDGSVGHLPTVPRIGELGSSPLASLLGQLGLEDLRPLHSANPKLGTPKAPASGRFIAGFVCPSDHHVLTRPTPLPAPVSYRFNSGANRIGDDGPFSPGRTLSLSGVAGSKGLDYAIGVSERLVGNGKPERDYPGNYLAVAGTLTGDVCPSGGSVSEGMNAGGDWTEAGWRSSLYNHVLPPGGRPSCIDQDQRSAIMTASSGHVQAVRVLYLNGAVKNVTNSVDASVWRRLGTLKVLASRPVSAVE